MIWYIVKGGNTFIWFCKPWKNVIFQCHTLTHGIDLGRSPVYISNCLAFPNRIYPVQQCPSNKWPDLLHILKLTEAKSTLIYTQFPAYGSCWPNKEFECCSIFLTFSQNAPNNHHHKFEVNEKVSLMI